MGTPVIDQKCRWLRIALGYERSSAGLRDTNLSVMWHRLRHQLVALGLLVLSGSRVGLRYVVCPDCGGRMWRTAMRCRTCANGGPQPPLREMTDSALAWTAGLVEGEGTFTNSTSSSLLRVVMTDLDVLERLERITGVGNIRAVASKQPHHKQAYSWQVKRREHMEPLAQLLWPLLGERRRSQMSSCKTFRQLSWPEVSPPPDDLSGPAAAWVAGVLEGEGSFTLSRRHGGRIDLVLTDRDIVERVHALTDGDLYHQDARRESWKPTTRLVIRGRQRLLRVLRPILPWLLQRRAESAWAIYEWSNCSGWPGECGDPGCRTR